MLLSDLGPAVCLAYDPRYPTYFQRVRRQVEALGVYCSPWLNGSADSPRVDLFHQLNDVPPPPRWSSGPGEWNHCRAVREILVRARESDLSQFLFFEDDAEFTPDAAQILADAEVPDDWEILYLGAYHCWADTEPVGRNVLRVRGSVGVHAVAFRRSIYTAAINCLGDRNSDQALADFLHSRGTSYAIFPAAAIQPMETSTMTGLPGGWPELFKIRSRHEMPR